jgi:hypothetical protein
VLIMIKELGLAYYRLPVEEEAVFLSSVFDVVYVLQSSSACSRSRFALLCSAVFCCSRCCVAQCSRFRGVVVFLFPVLAVSQLQYPQPRTIFSFRPAAVGTTTVCSSVCAALAAAAGLSHWWTLVISIFLVLGFTCTL